ncbi:peptide-aspartate beta-dioxygenase [Aureococcus anophagefferens]|nr:peptide-aspartate beta-dioxygenase [Aureococcus anophagefferens]
MTLDDGERQRAHDDAFARGERPAGLGPRSEAVFDAWRAAWAVYAAPETPESGSLHLKTQCMDFMTKRSAGDGRRPPRARRRGPLLRGPRADAASDDAALELMIALQNDFSDMDAARLCAERHIDGCAAARRACRWADAWQRPGVYSAPSLLGRGAWRTKLADAVVGAVAGAFPMIMEERRRARAAGRADVDPSWREVVLVARAGGDGVTEAAAAACPRTIGLLTSLDAVREAAELGVAEVVLSALGPGTELAPDTGATNLRLTAHLCLLAPKTDRPCDLRCGDPGLAGSSRRYAEGAVLLYDDSFEHAAVHDGETDSGDRVVLSVQFFHPRLSRSQRQAEVRSALEAVQRRKIKTQFGSSPRRPHPRDPRRPGNALM